MVKMPAKRTLAVVTREETMTRRLRRARGHNPNYWQEGDLKYTYVYGLQRLSHVSLINVATSALTSTVDYNL
jgi:hypothetical protein